MKRHAVRGERLTTVDERRREHDLLRATNPDRGEVAADMAVLWQNQLHTQLCARQVEHGRPLREVASELGISVEELTDALRGERDLTVSEIQQLLIAFELVADVHIEPVSHWQERYLISTWRGSLAVDSAAWRNDLPDYKETARRMVVHGGK